MKDHCEGERDKEVTYTIHFSVSFSTWSYIYSMYYLIVPYRKRLFMIYALPLTHFMCWTHVWYSIYLSLIVGEVMRELRIWLLLSTQWKERGTGRPYVSPSLDHWYCKRTFSPLELLSPLSILLLRQILTMMWRIIAKSNYFIWGLLNYITMSPIESRWMYSS